MWRRLKDDSVEIQEILSLSYDDLSFQMKRYFLYFARFLEDQRFEVNELMKLLIAEEFIYEADEGNRLFMEDMAKDYLNELVNRNMIQIAELRFNGQLHMCRMHDLVRDFAIQKAREHKLLDIFDSSKQIPNPISLHEIPRHAIHKGIGDYLLLEPKSDDSKLPSLALLDGTNPHVKIEVDTVNLTNLLHTLSIIDEAGGGEYPMDSVPNLTALQSFCLKCYCYNPVPTLKPLSFCKRLNYVLLKCTIHDPSEFKNLPDSLTYLTLQGSRFEKDPMPTLGNFSNLTNLILEGEAYKGEKMVCSRNLFPTLIGGGCSATLPFDKTAAVPGVGYFNLFGSWYTV
ncbi:putative disease resistance RPP13-like protein 2 [Apium graveolens]|uniref:putative disease resistance RPP13-like protein 2 n=1 Tax=Apium graveolens TaxID=4045 RepID=UPI003D7A8CB7